MHHKVSSVISDGVSDIDDLRKKIRSNYRREKPDILAHVLADQLNVYANRAVYDDKEFHSLGYLSVIVSSVVSRVVQSFKDDIQ